MNNALYLSMIAFMLLSCGDSEKVLPGQMNVEETVDKSTATHIQKDVLMKFNSDVTLEYLRGSTNTMVNISKGETQSIDLDGVNKLTVSYISGGGNRFEISLLENINRLKKLEFILPEKIGPYQASNAQVLTVCNFRTESCAQGDSVIVIKKGMNNYSCKSNDIKCFQCSGINTSEYKETYGFYAKGKDSPVKLGISNIRDVTISEIVLDDGLHVGGSIK